jgi:hypothetical protein
VTPQQHETVGGSEENLLHRCRRFHANPDHGDHGDHARSPDLFLIRVISLNQR